MNYFLFIFGLLLPSYAFQFSHNIAYNGPFNPYINQQPRRLLLDSYPTDNVKFFHGVASGDPTSQTVLLWTRVTPPFQNKYAMDQADIFSESQLNELKSNYEILSVQWAISSSISTIDFDCSSASEKCGATETEIDVDYTIKVIVDGLKSNTWYYYQFKIGNTTSDIGRTKTIPSSNTVIDSWRFAFGSCKQTMHGYFNNLRDIAARDDLDMMLWLGDYIYEFPDTSLVNGTAIGRTPFPNNYLYELDHYRKRYLSHKLESDVRSVHAKMAWIMVWDDHEVVNDYWMDDAPSKWQDDALYNVTFEQRRLNGYQAFFEWNPVTTIDVDTVGGLYKSFRMGNLMDLIIVDSRSQRTEPADNITSAADLPVDQHYAFGETQRNWIIKQLKQSQSDGTKWRVFGSNDVFGQSPPAHIFNGKEIFGEDKLEGYDAERQILIDAVIDNNINNIVCLAGGPHTGIAQKVYSTGKPIQNSSDSYPVFTEITVDAICAPKLFEDTIYVPYLETLQDEWSWVAPYFRFQVDGYSIMDININRVKIEFWVNDNVQDSKTKSVLDATFCISDGIVDFNQCNAITDHPTTMPTSAPLTIAPYDDEKGTKYEMETWVTVLIVIACVICFVVIVTCVLYVKRKQGHKEVSVDDDERIDDDNEKDNLTDERTGMITNKSDNVELGHVMGTNNDEIR